MTHPKPDDEKGQLVCNLCGRKRRDAKQRLLYPAHACGWCYRQWKRGRA